MRTIAIGEILGALPIGERKRVLHILELPNELEATKQLKDLLRGYESDLNKVGVIADCAAYALIYARNKMSQ